MRWLASLAVRSFAILASLAVLACAPPAIPPRSGAAHRGLLRIATWNVHDLFDAEDRLLPPGERDTVLAPAAAEAKLAAVARVLARLDADVVILQEVENAAVLEELAARVGYAEARLVEAGDPRGIDVAALTRLPVLAYVSHAGDRDADGLVWPRDCTELHVDAGGRRLVLLGSHFSSPLSDDGTRRQRQARRMRAIADALASAGLAVVAGGDLNDEPGSPALDPLLGDGAWVSVGAGLPDGWTWSGGRARRVIDHLMVAQGGPIAPLAVEVLAGADVAGASDHRPVAIDVLLE